MKQNIEQNPFWALTHSTQPKKRTPRLYVKPYCLRVFENEFFRKHYEPPLDVVPLECRVKTKFSDDTANHLTMAICAWLDTHGHFSARINTTGQYDPKTKSWRRSGSTVGMADVSAVIHGRHVSFEIKIGNDRPRAEQLNVQKQIVAAGGIYEFVHSFEEFLHILNKHGLIEKHEFVKYFEQ